MAKKTDGPQTVTRTTTLKVKNTQDKLKLLKVFIDNTNVCSLIYRDIHNMSLKEYKDKDNNVVINPEKFISDLESNIGRKLNDEDLSKMKSVFNSFVNEKDSRDATNAFTLPKRENSDSDGIKYIKDNLNILPFRYLGEEYDVLNRQSGLKYSVFGSIHDRLSSYVKCNNSTHEEYEKLKCEIESQTNTIIEQFGEDSLNSLNEWLLDIQSQYEQNSKSYSQFCLNWKFLTFYKNQLESQLVKWKSDNSVEVSNKGSWVTKSGKKIKYSCGEYVIESLKKYPTLWQKEDSILSFQLLSDYIELRNKFSRKKEYSSYKDIDLYNSPIKMMLGNNFVKFNNIQNDTSNHVLSMTLGMPKSIKEDNKSEKIILECAYKRKGHGKNFYLQNLEIENYKDSKGDKKPGIFNFKFKINGKRERVAIVKQPSLRLVIRNQKINLKSPKLSDFDFYVDLCMNVVVNSTHGYKNEDLYKYRAELSRSFPEQKAFGNQKSLKKETKKSITVPNGLRVMGIDLGIKNPFAYAIYEYDCDGNHKFVKSGLSEPCNDNYYKIYSDFGYLCENIKRVISNLKRYLNNGEELDENSFKSVLTLFKKFDTIIGKVDYSFIDYKKCIDQKVNDKIELQDFKKDRSWMLREWVTHCRTIQKHCVQDRIKDRADWRKHFFWIRALESYRSMFISYNKVGSKSKSKGFKDVTDFKSIYNSVNNLKLDYIKKLSSSIAEIAKDNKVSLVVLENLEQLRGNKFMDVDKNQLFNLWPVGMIKKFIEDSLAIYGVLVGNADEKNTSQVDSDNGNWGYRGEKEEIDILYLPDNKIVNADVNASKNICLRYLNHHTDLRQLAFYKVDDIHYIPCVSVKESGEGTKRTNGFLTKQYGVSKLVFEKSGNSLVVSNMTFTDLKKSVKKMETERETWYALDNSFKEWINRDSRNELIEKVKCFYKK